MRLQQWTLCCIKCGCNFDIEVIIANRKVSREMLECPECGGPGDVMEKGPIYEGSIPLNIEEDTWDLYNDE